jgi:AraC-like protein
MQLGTTPLLERHQVLRSHDAEETPAFLGGKGYLIDLSPRQAKQLNTRINAVYMSSLYLGFVHYGSLPIALVPAPARSDSLVQLPIRWHLAAGMGDESVDSNPFSRRHRVASARAAPVRFLCAHGTRLQPAVGQAALSGQLVALLGEPPKVPLDFAPAMDLTTGYGRRLAQHVLMGVASLDAADSVLLNPITMSAFEQVHHDGTVAVASAQLQRGIPTPR